VYHRPLDVRQVLVVFQTSGHSDEKIMLFAPFAEASLFAQIGAIVVEHLVAEDCICSMKKIHFKQAGLQMAQL
jgi:hypothetical protein